MDSLLNFLATTKTLWISFILMLICGAGFGLFIGEIGGTLLDTTWTQEAALGTLAAMTDSQKDTHFWVTVLLDTLYPIAYGAFFIGLIARLAQHHRSWAIWPSIIGVDADFVENIVQALALNGNTGWLFLKDFATPLKFTGLAIGLVLIIAFAIINRMSARH